MNLNRLQVLFCLVFGGLRNLLGTTSLQHKRVRGKTQTTTINFDRKETLIGITNDKNCRSKQWLVKPKRISLINPVLHSYPDCFSAQSILKLTINYLELSRNKRCTTLQVKYYCLFLNWIKRIAKIVLELQTVWNFYFFLKTQTKW